MPAADDHQETQGRCHQPADRNHPKSRDRGIHVEVPLTRITANFTTRAAQSNALDHNNGELRVVNPDGTQEVWRLMG